ncbi:MAG: hypothetical protein KAR40_15015 [Candidatus Sabulitectum sp.]|nr:hypothetical protein [Candidatus Sabulitectum sp.]
MDPIWSCQFDEAQYGPDGSIDYDGEYIWIHPEGGDLFKLSINWTPSGLNRATWASIKSSF